MIDSYNNISLDHNNRKISYVKYSSLKNNKNKRIKTNQRPTSFL